MKKTLILVFMSAALFCGCATTQDTVNTADSAVDTTTGRSQKTRSQGQAVVNEYNTWKGILGK